MTRREMLNSTLLRLGCGATVLELSGCVSRIEDSARDPAFGKPWRCRKCGHLIRSNEDLTNVRCPRCLTKNYQRISENAMQKYLAE